MCWYNRIKLGAVKLVLCSQTTPVSVVMRSSKCFPYVSKMPTLIYKKSLNIPNGIQNPYIEEEQTTQWPKEKVQKDKQRSTKHTNKTKDLQNIHIKLKIYKTYI